MQPINPLSSIRLAGPLGTDCHIKSLPVLIQFFSGPWFINTLRPDISRKYASTLNDPDVIPQYIYQCNSQYPRQVLRFTRRKGVLHSGFFSGESAFRAMMDGIGWAKHPMERRIHLLNSHIPITLLWGSKTWIEHSAEDILKTKRSNSYFDQKVMWYSLVNSPANEKLTLPGDIWGRAPRVCR